MYIHTYSYILLSANEREKRNEKPENCVYRGKTWQSKAMLMWIGWVSKAYIYEYTYTYLHIHI